MVEPLSITTSIAGILGGVATVASKINTLKQRYGQSELNITLTASMLFSVKRALEAIQEMRDNTHDTSNASLQLDKDLSVPLESCAVLIAMIERSIEGIDLEHPSRAERWRFVALNETFVQAERSLDTQVRALSLLLQIYQCGTLAEQTARLKHHETRHILERVRNDTASTVQLLEDREGSDAASILSSEPSVKFMFDDDLLQHAMYQRVYPHLWRKNKLGKNRDSTVSVAVPQSAPPVPLKDPTNHVQSPSLGPTESETLRASQPPPVPPKSASPPRPETAVHSPAAAGTLSPKPAEKKGHKKKKSKSSGTDPLLGALPSIPFLGIPFQGEEMDYSESEESETEKVPVEDGHEQRTASDPNAATEDAAAEPSEVAAAATSRGPEETVTSNSTEISANEETRAPLASPSHATTEPQRQPQSASLVVRGDAESDLYGVSGDEQEPNVKRSERRASQQQVSQDIPTINIPANETTQPVAAISVHSATDEATEEPNESASEVDHSAQEQSGPTEIDRIVSHIRNHRARAATDAASATSIRGSSRGRSVSDGSAVDRVNLDVDLQSRSPSRGESVSTRSDQPSPNTHEPVIDVFSPKLDLPLLENGAGSFEINFDQRSSDAKASSTGPSPAVSSAEKTEFISAMDNLSVTQLHQQTPSESGAEQSAEEEQSRSASASASASAAPSQTSSPSRLPAVPVRAPPAPPPASTSPPAHDTVPDHRPPPVHAPPPPPASVSPPDHDALPDHRPPPVHAPPPPPTGAAPTSATLRSPPVLPPLHHSPSPSPEGRRSSITKHIPPPIPTRPVSRPVSQPPPPAQQPSPQPSPSPSQSQMQPSPASTPGLPTARAPPVPPKKIPPPVPPPRLARSPAHRRISSASQATNITEQSVETVTAESPRRPPPPVPDQTAQSPSLSNASARPSPHLASRSYSAGQEEAGTPTSVHAQTPPMPTLSPQMTPTSAYSTGYSTAEVVQPLVSDNASTVGSTMSASGSFWDAHSVASTHQTTANTNDPSRLPLDPADDTPEQAEQRRVMKGLGQYDQTGRTKHKLLPKTSTSRISNIFSSKDKALKLRAMHEAVRAGQLGLLDEMLRDRDNRKSLGGFESIAQNENPKTMLMRAAEGDHVECMKALVRAGADVAQADRRGQIALHYAIENVSLNATFWLAQNPISTTSSVSTLEMEDENGLRPLHIAAAKGNLRMMDILMQHGAVVDARDKYGRSPLFTATISSNLRAIDKLISHGASLAQVDNDGRTPLMWAVEYDCPLAVDAFLARNADRHARDREGNTVIHVAARSGRLDLIDKLYLAKNDVEAENNTGERPLHLAAAANKAPVVKALLGIGCDPNAFTKPQNTSHNRRKNAKRGNYKELASSPLHYACANGAYDPAAALVENGAVVNANLEDGTSPLMLAAEVKCVAIVALLMEFGANVEAKTSVDQLTVLHIAAAVGDIDSVKLLANNGAPIRAVNKKKETPWQYATKNGTKNTEATSWLSKYSRGQILTTARQQGTLTSQSAVPSMPSAMYANSTLPTQYTATGYVPNHTTFYQPPHIEASIRTEEGIEPPPAYSPRGT